MSSLRTLITDTVRYCWNQRSRSQVIFLGKTFSNSGRFASLAELKRWLEREKRGGNEGKENADPRSGNMGEETTAKGEGVSGGGFRDCGSDIPPNGSTGSRQSLCCCRGCSRPRYLYSHLQAHEGEDLCRVCWAFCVYLEAISVLPQLRVMQNTKIVEPFTAHYVFALGVARFLSCAHWVLQVMDSQGRILTALGYGLWPSMVLLSEIVQTFILADFCYYYVKSLVGGQLVLRLPSGVV
eukprot:XP_019071820.1 PREDICTED: uncharacterized protein LOC100243720 isoform X2 [Vitis vinifera]